jgi:hypothetical protein
MPSLVQSGNSGTTSTSSGAAATVFAANTTVGNTVLVCVQIGVPSAPDVTSITSSIGTFTRVNDFSDGNNDYEWWVCLAATGAAKTVTITTTGGQPYTAMAMEWRARRISWRSCPKSSPDRRAASRGTMGR